jgi:hypothetical protein
LFGNFLGYLHHDDAQTTTTNKNQLTLSVGDHMDSTNEATTSVSPEFRNSDFYETTEESTIADNELLSTELVDTYADSFTSNTFPFDTVSYHP